MLETFKFDLIIAGHHVTEFVTITVETGFVGLLAAYMGIRAKYPTSPLEVVSHEKIA